MASLLGAAQLVLCAVVALIAASGWSPSAAASPAAAAAAPIDVPLSILEGPATSVSGQLVQLERHSNSPARMRVVTHTIFTSGNDLDAMFRVMHRSLARKTPFLIIWDIRKLRFPRLKVAQVRQVKEWLKGHLVAWDTHVQGHAIILSNPIARTFAWLLIRAFSPPQPVTIARDEAEADEFARTCCSKPRSYVKTPEEYAAKEKANVWKAFGLR